MGKTSKPLHIVIHQSLFDADREKWAVLVAQGHTIETCPPTDPDILLAPYAMRMTADMLKQLPTAFELAVKGARALRHGPTGDDSSWKKGKVKGVSNKAKGKRKNSKKQVEAAPGGQPEASTEAPGDRGTAVEPVGEASHIEGDGQA